MYKPLIQVLLLVLYAAMIWMAFRNISPVISPWFSTVISLVLIFTYHRLTIGKYIFPLVAISMVTVIFPLGVLVAMGVPASGSWASSAKSLFGSMANHFISWMPQFIPLIASIFFVLLLKRHSNNVHNSQPPTVRTPKRSTH